MKAKKPHPMRHNRQDQAAARLLSNYSRAAKQLALDGILILEREKAATAVSDTRVRINMVNLARANAKIDKLMKGFSRTVIRQVVEIRSLMLRGEITVEDLEGDVEQGKAESKREREILLLDGMRVAYQEGKVPARHAKEVESMPGWSWTPMRARLAEFEKKHGHTNVPIDWEEDPDLAEWRHFHSLWVDDTLKDTDDDDILVPIRIPVS